MWICAEKKQNVAIRTSRNAKPSQRWYQASYAGGRQSSPLVRTNFEQIVIDEMRLRPMLLAFYFSLDQGEEMGDHRRHDHEDLQMGADLEQRPKEAPENGRQPAGHREQGEQ